MTNEGSLEAQWDKVYDDFKGGRQSVWKESASPFFVNKIDYLKRLGFASVLDAGCGDGRNLLEFAKAGFEVTGVDFSDSALKRAKEVCNNYSTVHLSKQSLENLNFKAESFDVILCDFVMAHMEKPEIVLQNFYKVLKKGGYALIEFTSIKDPHFGQGDKIAERQYLQKGIYLRFYTLEEVKELLKDFKILSIDSHYHLDPNHGSGYNRKERHKHHSFFVFAQKK